MTESPVTLDGIQTKVREFLVRFTRHHDLRDDEDIFARGVVTSMFAMQLVLFIEKTFAIAVENEDLLLENLNTIGHIASLVDRKLSRASAAASASLQ